MEMQTMYSKDGVQWMTEREALKAGLIQPVDCYQTDGHSLVYRAHQCPTFWEYVRSWFTRKTHD